MHQLNLPPYDHKLKNVDGKVWIFDVIRKKYLVLTPEEWVRQHFVNYLIGSCNYPRSLIKVEGGLRFNTLHKRSDIVVFDRQGNPWMIVECKSPDILISAETLRQVSLYNASLRARFVTVTNGLTNYCCRTLWDEKQVELITGLPAFGDT
jgi:hypothetical protein